MFARLCSLSCQVRMKYKAISQRPNTQSLENIWVIIMICGLLTC